MFCKAVRSRAAFFLPCHNLNGKITLILICKIYRFNKTTNPSTMKKKITLLFFLIGISLTQAQDKKEFKVNFATDSYLLDAAEANKLNTFIQSLADSPNRYTVAIAGHTDSVGEIAYNAVLSDKRANTVAEIFKGKGFLESKVLTSGRGEVHPIADNASENGKAKNRRVRIIATPDVRDGSATEKKPSAAKARIGGLKLEETAYRVDAGKDETVHYKSGTKISIPKNSFVDKDGNPVGGKVDLKYIEYRDPIDFILSDIEMDHGGGHFNSGGMYKILASQNGRPVFIGKGKSIDIDFMLTDNLPEMNFYRYDSLSGKWSEKAKIATGYDFTEQEESFSEVVDLASTGRFTSTADILKASDANAPMCTQSDCSSVFALKRYAGKLALPGNSAYAQWANFGKAQDSTVLAMRARFDSIYRSNPEMLKPAKRELLQSAERTLSKRTAAVNSLLLKIKRMTPIYTIKKLKTKEGILLKIALKAIYNIEMANFSQTRWQYVGGETLDKSVYGTKWEHCDIRKNNDGTYTAILEKGTDKKELGPLKIITDATNVDAMVASMNLTESLQYSKIGEVQDEVQKAEWRACMAQRLLDVEKGIPSDMLAGCSKNRNSQNNPMYCFWDRSKEYMTAAETSMGLEEWLRYFDENKETMATRYASIGIENECLRLAKTASEKQQKLIFANRNAQAVTKSLKISSLGIYNCDQIERLIDPLIVDAQYRNEKGETIKPVFIYLVDSRINGILKYDGYMRYSPSHFAYSPYSENTLLAFDGEGGSYIIKSDDFRKAVENPAGMKAFTMKKIENLDRREDLQAMF